LNVETKMKRKQHSSRRLSFNELTIAKKYDVNYIWLY